MTATMTQAKLRKLVRSGCGSGRDGAYRPWIRIRRKQSSPVSNLYSFPAPLHSRDLQLLSGLEFKAANVALWLSCGEIREQHPAWPWPHRHPATGRHPQLDSHFDDVPGLLEVAKDAGIDHGVYPGTKIPFVATIDFTLTVGLWHRFRLVHWSCKPRELLDSAPNRARMAERIELERRYSNIVGATHVVIDGTQFPGMLSANLDWLRPLPNELTHVICMERLKEYAGALMQVSADETLSCAKRKAARRAHVPAALAEDYFRAAAWLALIDIDLTQHVVSSLPLRRDSSFVRSRLGRDLLGTPNEERAQG